MTFKGDIGNTFTGLETRGGGGVVAACRKLSLALARVLSIAARTRTPKACTRSGQSEHPHFHLRQSKRDLPAAPIRTRELSSPLTGQRRIPGLFGASR